MMTAGTCGTLPKSLMMRKARRVRIKLEEMCRGPMVARESATMTRSKRDLR